MAMAMGATCRVSQLRWRWVRLRQDETVEWQWSAGEICAGSKGARRRMRSTVIRSLKESRGRRVYNDGVAGLLR